MIDVLSDLAGVKGFIVAHVNCRSILPKIDFLKHQLLDKPIDVLCLSETWLKTAIPDALVMIDGYNLARLDRATQVRGQVKTGGGIGLDINDAINFKLHEDVSVTTPDIELLAVTLTFECRNCFILTCYRPPGAI